MDLRFHPLPSERTLLLDPKAALIRLEAQGMSCSLYFLEKSAHQAYHYHG